MPRITVPGFRAVGSAAASSLRDSSAGTAGTALMPKYAELLRSRDHRDPSRGLSTAHRPAPRPSLANRPRLLEQSFRSAVSSAAPSPTLDTAVFPSIAELFAASDRDPSAGFRMPLLPDNYSAAHGPAGGDGPVHLPSIVAADPDNVLPAAPLSNVGAIGLDTVDLKFAHEQPHQPQRQPHDGTGGMIRDLWKGMVEDVIGPAKK